MGPSLALGGEIIDPLPLPGVPAPEPAAAAAAAAAPDATFRKMLALFDAVGVPGAEAVRLLRAMAAAIILSKASTPLQQQLYRAFDFLGFPAKLTRPAIQRVGASERDVRCAARVLCWWK
jgi:hypothetical protein